MKSSIRRNAQETSTITSGIAIGDNSRPHLSMIKQYKLSYKFCANGESLLFLFGKNILILMDLISINKTDIMRV